MAWRPAARWRDDRRRAERRVRSAGGDVGISFRGAQRTHEPRGADCLGVGVVLRDGALERPRQGRHPAGPARDLRDGDVPARRGDRQGRVDRARDRLRPRRGGVQGSGRGREAELPCLEGARRGSRREPRGVARLRTRVAALDELVTELDRSYADAQERMSDPAVYNDHREAADVGRRLKELEGPWKLAQQWKQARADLDAARGDAELAEMVAGYETDVARLEDQLKFSLAARDPADAKDVIVEVRQGVGGDEAALWAEDLAKMLQRYAERRGFKWEELEVSPNEGGGVAEGVFAIKGDGAYSVFKFEGG